MLSWTEHQDVHKFMLSWNRKASMGMKGKELDTYWCRISVKNGHGGNCIGMTFC